MLMVHTEPSTYGAGIAVALIIMAIRATLSMTLNGLMLVTFTGFPIAYLASVFGVLQVVARLVGVLGPITAEGSDLLDAKIMFCILAFCAAIINGLLFEEKKSMILSN